MKLRVSRLISPYQANGRTNIAFTQGKAGAYLIYRDSKLVYIGFSATNLYATILRHFQAWNDPRGPRVTYHKEMHYHDFKLRIVRCSAARAAKLERALIIQHRPKDNTDKLENYLPTPAEKDVYYDYQTAPASSLQEMEDAPF